MYCHQCGSSNKDDAFYCTRCGCRIKDEQEPDNSSSSRKVGAYAVEVTPPKEVTISKRSQEDREALHTYLVTSIGEYRPLAMHSLTRDVKSMVSEVIGGEVGDLVGTLARDLLRRFNPGGGVVCGTSVADVESERIRREALFQQQAILKLAADYLERAPWITYLTALKCRPFLEHFDISTQTFSDLKEKQLVDALERYAEELVAKSEMSMTDDSKQDIARMFHFESIRAHLQEATEVISRIIASENRAIVLSTLMGHEVSIPSRTIKLPNGSILRFLGKIIMAPFAGGVLYILFVNGRPAASDQTILPIACALMGFAFGFWIYGIGNDRRKSATNELVREQQRVESVENEVNFNCREFELKVKPQLREIGISSEEALLDLEVASNAFHGLLEQVGVLRDRYTETRV